LQSNYPETQKIQQHLQPVNNLTGNAAQCKPKTQVKTQKENLFVAQGRPPTTLRLDIENQNRIKTDYFGCLLCNKPLFQHNSLKFWCRYVLLDDEH
jgi:hypothetical protein